MAITTLDGYIGAAKQTILHAKTATITAVAQQITSVGHLAGSAGSTTLAGTNATVGVIQTDALTGYPVINAFTGGAKGYISRIGGYYSVSGRLILVDFLLKLGTFAFNAAVSGLTTLDISGRVPGGTDFTGCEIWLEAVTAFTGNQTIAVTYIDGNNAAQTTGTIATGVAPIIGRCLRLPRANGRGVKSITGVTSTVSTVGTFNVLIVRPLHYMRIPFAGYSEQRDLYGTGMPEVFADSALGLFVQPDSTASALPAWEIEIANG
jgi:hypothetical protein